MTSETELFGRDSVKLNILKELVSGDINISVSLNGGVYQDYISQIHSDENHMQVLGKFNLSEDSSGGVLTVRPIAVSGKLRVTFGFGGELSGGEKNIAVYRKSTKSIENQFEINPSLVSVEFIPQGNVKYLLRVTYKEGESPSAPENRTGAEAAPRRHAGIPRPEAAPVMHQSLDDFESSTSGRPAQPSPNAPNVPPAPTPRPPRATAPAGAGNQESDPELAAMQEEIKVKEEKLKNLRERRNSAKDLLKKLEAEYQKDYDEFGRELEELRAQTGVDQSVIDYYREYDIQPMESLLKEISEKLVQAEKQISLVILAGEQKTVEIENEIKSGKRQ